MDGFIYSHLVGGAVFAVGIVYAAKQGYVGLRGAGLRNLVVLLGGFAALAALQGWLEYAPMTVAPPSETEVPPHERRLLGTPLDYGIMVSYFVAILAVGTWFGRRQKTVRDFFFGGQRFSWWLIALSLVATTVGSYSFVKYSQMGYEYGLSSGQSYLNDWFWMPLLAFGWLPLLYFSRVTSIPEYFERRFDRRVRGVVTAVLLVYLIGYVGVNLFTMGKALHILVGWSIPTSAIIVATISAIYVTAGGQTSVIMTDLLQGFMLLVAGVLIFVLGIDYIGGTEAFWTNLPRAHRAAFSPFNSDPEFPAVGVFWQDAMANSAMFYFLNQGIIMRFLAARSLAEARKAALFVPVILMPIAAAVVASGGWIGKSMENAGLLPHGLRPEEVFFVATEVISRPGVFGIVMAALTAALMSTVDTLITAIAAVVVNDVYRPYVRPEAQESELLWVARATSIGVTVVGIALVPVFMAFGSIYAAHGAFTAAVTPPLVVALLLSVFWRRYTRAAALWTVAGGTVAMFLSLVFPELVAPFAHGVPPGEAGEGLLGGAKQYKFMRALYGLVVCGVIGVVVTWFTRPEPVERVQGLVWGTVSAALARYKGSPGVEAATTRATAAARRLDSSEETHGEAHLPGVAINLALARALDAGPGDLVYVSDGRRWLGGLQSTHALVERVTDDPGPAAISLGPDAWERVVTRGREGAPLAIERLYGSDARP
jgi:SSS family solute:Na+ symporter